MITFMHSTLQSESGNLPLIECKSKIPTNMQQHLLLDVQRKILGGYINAEEFGNNKILEQRISESLFDLKIHRAIARACNKLIDEDMPVTEYTVLDFLNKHNMPNNVHDENEYLLLMTTYAITEKSYKQYIDMVLRHKLES